MTFEEEFVALLKKHGVAYDPIEVHIRLRPLCRASGALTLNLSLTHGVAVGYPVVAPTGAWSECRTHVVPAHSKMMERKGTRKRGQPEMFSRFLNTG